MIFDGALPQPAVAAWTPETSTEARRTRDVESFIAKSTEARQETQYVNGEI